mgnify:CR=1 FL=1
MSTRPIDPTLEYILLGSNGASAVVDGGEKFWSQPHERLERFGRGWLVSEYACEKDWPNWEMHPEADELVYVLDGDVELLLEKPAGVETVRGASKSGLSNRLALGSSTSQSRRRPFPPM